MCTRKWSWRAPVVQSQAGLLEYKRGNSGWSGSFSIERLNAAGFFTIGGRYSTARHRLSNLFALHVVIEKFNIQFFGLRNPMQILGSIVTFAFCACRVDFSWDMSNLQCSFRNRYIWHLAETKFFPRRNAILSFRDRKLYCSFRMNGIVLCSLFA